MPVGKACATHRGELQGCGVPGRSQGVLFNPYTLVFKSKGAVWFGLRCLVSFFTIVANIYTNRPVNNSVVFLSSNQLSKRLRGDLYSLEQLGFLEEGRRGGHGTSLCSHSGFALCLQPQGCTTLPSQFSPGRNDLSEVKDFFWLLF